MPVDRLRLSAGTPSRRAPGPADADQPPTRPPEVAVDAPTADGSFRASVTTTAGRHPGRSGPRHPGAPRWAGELARPPLRRTWLLGAEFAPRSHLADGARALRLSAATVPAILLRPGAKMSSEAGLLAAVVVGGSSLRWPSAGGGPRSRQRSQLGAPGLTLRRGLVRRGSTATAAALIVGCRRGDGGRAGADPALALYVRHRSPYGEPPWRAGRGVRHAAVSSSGWPTDRRGVRPAGSLVAGPRRPIRTVVVRPARVSASRRLAACPARAVGAGG